MWEVPWSRGRGIILRGKVHSGEQICATAQKIKLDLPEKRIMKYVYGSLVSLIGMSVNGFNVES